MLYWKIKIRKLKEIVVDSKLMEKRKLEAGITEADVHDVSEAKKVLEKVKEEWNDIIERGKKIREKELLDFHHSEVMCENEDQRKTKKKIIGEIKKKMQKTHAFHYISRHIGKGERESIKRIHTIDDNQKI